MQTAKLLTERVLAELNSEIESLTTREHALQQQLTYVSQALSQTRTRQAALVSSMAPVSCLPPELLSEIFLLAHRDSKSVSTSKRTLPLFELRVSSVSTHWRAIALNTPQLWSTIYIVPTISYSSVNLYIDRVNSGLIDIVFDFTSDSETPTWTVWDPLISTAGQWRSMTLYTAFAPVTVYNTLAHLETVGAPQLTSVELHSTYDGPDLMISDIGGNTRGYNFAETVFTGGTERLAKLSLVGLGLRYSYPPLATLSELSFHELAHKTLYTYTALRTLFKSTVKLERLSIHGAITRSKLPTPLIPISILSLKALRIRGTAALNKGASDLLLILATPNLTSLHLLDLIDGDLAPFLNHDAASPGCKYPVLRTLVLSHPRFITSTAEAIARMFPQTNSLVLVCREATPLLSILHEGPPGFRSHWATMWPSLQTLALCPTYPHRHDLQSLLTTRKAEGVPISKVYVDPSFIHGSKERVERIGEELEVQVGVFETPPAWPEWQDEF